MKTLHRTLAVALLLASGLSVCAAPTLVGHPGLKGQAFDNEAIKAVLLGKRITIANSRVIIVIVKSSDDQEAFLASHVSMSTSQFQNYWRRLFMTGGGSAPKVVESEEDARKLVAVTPGAVAIINSATTGELIVLAN